MTAPAPQGMALHGGELASITARGRTAALLTFTDGSTLELHLAGVAGAGLHPGAVLDAAGLAGLRAEDERLRAQAAALRMLARGPRSSSEVRRKLRERSFTEPVVAGVLARLGELGLLGDAAFARHYVEARDARPRSRRLLAWELSTRGIGGETAAGAVAAIDDEEAAERAARGRLPALGGLDREAFWRRLGGFLYRRGFDYEVAGRVMERLWRELRAGQAPE